MVGCTIGVSRTRVPTLLFSNSYPASNGQATDAVRFASPPARPPPATPVLRSGVDLLGSLLPPLF
jgi:hypothetical protein